MANTAVADSDGALDAQTELKRRARRRLVGASALALLAAVVLPMVMDHQPRPPAQDIQVRIPSQDTGFTARIQPTKPTPLPPAETRRTDTKPEPKAETKPEPKAEAKPEPKVEPKAELRSAPTAAKPVPDKSPERPTDKAAGKPAERREEARAAAALAGGEQWVVQLGAYKEAGNVKLLTAKLKEMGVPSYTEQMDSPQGPRTRVRAGPFPSREAAEKAQARIRKIGVDGPVAPRQ